MTTDYLNDGFVLKIQTPKRIHTRFKICILNATCPLVPRNLLENFSKFYAAKRYTCSVIAYLWALGKRQPSHVGRTCVQATLETILSHRTDTFSKPIEKCHVMLYVDYLLRKVRENR